MRSGSTGSGLSSGVYFYRIQARPLDSAIGVTPRAGGDFIRPASCFFSDSANVEESFYTWNKEHFKFLGMCLLWQPVLNDGSADTAAIRRCLGGIDPGSFSGPWASMKDRSPVRRCYTKDIVRVLFQTALSYLAGVFVQRLSPHQQKFLRFHKTLS